eukprot:SAG11_NODE_1509_length_4774_cov_5.905668_2_plen_112_part_00
MVAASTDPSVLVLWVVVERAREGGEGGAPHIAAHILSRVRQLRGLVDRGHRCQLPLCQLLQRAVHERPIDPPNPRLSRAQLCHPAPAGGVPSATTGRRRPRHDETRPDRAI